jgi:hypothetical protein
MPLHDWTRVEAGIFHDFHVAWLPEMRKVLNGGLLPEGYYVLAEQHAGRAIADILTLHAGDTMAPLPPTMGGTAVAEAPPRVRRRHTADQSLRTRRRTLAIRHVSGHRLVALLEVVSPSNKDRDCSVRDFADKVAAALEHGIHVLVIDLLPPGAWDPRGIHGAILEQVDAAAEPYDMPEGEPATLASYSAGPPVDLYTEHAAVGARLPDMPLFIQPDRYVTVPLELTYVAAYSGVPGYWRAVLEGR